MAKLESISDLREYCLRRLGKPVINIEIDQTQADDRIDDAIEYFVERHFDGTTEAYYKLSVTHDDFKNKYVKVPDDLIVVTKILKESPNSSVEILDNFEYRAIDELLRTGSMSLSSLDYYLTMSNLQLVMDMFSPSRMFTYNNASNRLTPLFELSNVGSGNLLTSSADISKDSWTPINASLTANDTEVPNGKLLGDTVTSDAPGSFGFSQTIDTTYYVRGLYTGGISMYPGTYTGNVNISLYDASDTIVKTKTVSLVAGKWEYFFVEGTFGPTHKNGVKLVIETATGAAGQGETFHVAGISVFKNAILLVQGYKAVDPEISTDVYDDRWIKKYSTALIKQQWGSNVKKYSGVQLPGGIEMNGQQIYDEATTEIEKLEEEFSLQYELPIDFYMA